MAEAVMFNQKGKIQNNAVNIKKATFFNTNVKNQINKLMKSYAVHQFR